VIQRTSSASPTKAIGMPTQGQDEKIDDHDDDEHERRRRENDSAGGPSGVSARAALQSPSWQHREGDTACHLHDLIEGPEGSPSLRAFLRIDASRHRCAEGVATRAQGVYDKEVWPPTTVIRRDQQPGRPSSGQQVWVDGRPATLVCLHPSGQAAVVRFDDEQVARVVSLRKLHWVPEQIG
jgi:hypothetical protein